MALLPVTLRRRLRSSGLSEERTDALDEAGEASVEAARDGLATEIGVQSEYHTLRGDVTEVRNDIAMLRAQIATLRTETEAQLRALKWWLFGALAGLIVAATAAIIATIAVWG